MDEKIELTRIGGYIDLNDYFYKLTGRMFYSVEDLVEFGIGVDPEVGYYDKFWFLLNGERVLFKETEKGSYQGYSELVIEELAKRVGIVCAHYDLAFWGNCEGVLSYDFRKTGDKVLTGYDLLEHDIDYVENLISDKDMVDVYGIRGSEELVFDKMNNLEIIWQALDVYFKNHPNKDIVIPKIMTQLEEILIFDLITLQRDRHSFNWSIIERDGDAFVAPLYDNTHVYNFSYRRDGEGNIMGKANDVRSRLTSTSFSVNGNLCKVAEEFIRISDGIYTDRILSMLDTISCDIGGVLQDVDDRYGLNVPMDVKVEYKDAVISNIDSIRSMMGKVNKR